MDDRKLQQIIEGRLKSQQRIDRKIVHSLFDDLTSVTSRDYLSCTSFSDEKPYGRKMLYQSSQVEVLIIGFLPGRECPPHEHGSVDGLVLVCVGEVDHKIYRLNSDGLSLTARSHETQGSIFEAPMGCVHSMANGSDVKPLVTLHVYWPPISQMSIFDVIKKRIYLVSDNAGAWLPIDPSTMIEARKLD